MKPEIIFTERLVLRRANEKDSKNMFNNYFSDSESALFLTRKPHAHIDQTKQFLNEWCFLPWEKEYEKFAWIIALKDTDEGIGVFLVELENNYSAQIHYGIGRAHTRQGFVTEAGKAVVQWLFSQEKINRIWSVCDLSNEGSIKVLEKIGFEKEGVLKECLILPALGNAARDCYLYAYGKISLIPNIKPQQERSHED